MTDTPKRLLLSGFIICLLFGLFLDSINGRFSGYTNLLPSENSLYDQNGLSLARYYWRVGNFEKAIEEYQKAISDLPQNEPADPMYKELQRLISFNRSASGRIVGYIAYYAWLLPPRLYMLSFLMLLFLMILMIYQYKNKAPAFIIQPFYDRTGLNISNDLPKIAIDRIHEIVWFAQNLENASDLIADNIEIPTLGLVSEGDNQKVTELLEIAMLFSLGTTGLPFSHIISELKLWLDQPNYMVQGVMEKQDSLIILRMSLFNRREGCVYRLWHIEIPSDGDIQISKVVEAVIYPLLYHFNKPNTTRWQALQALHIGLEEFQFFKEEPNANNHLKAAQQHFERAIFLDPGYEIAKYNLALLLLAMGDFERAKDTFRELSHSTKDPAMRLRAKYNYGTVLFHMSQDWAYEQAAKTFTELLDQDDKNPLEYLLRSALSLTYAKMAVRHPKKDLIESALSESNKVIEGIKPGKSKREEEGKNTYSINEAHANAMSAKGFICIASNNHDQAIENFKKSLEIRPNNLSSILGLGEAYLGCGLNDEALDTFRKALIHSPMNGYVSYRLGNLYRELGKNEEAVEILQQAPNYAYARLTLGKIYLDNGDLDKALDELRQATLLNKNLSEAWVNIAWTILKKVEEEKEDVLLGEAVKAARRALQLEKSDKQRWHRHAILAHCLYRTKKYAKALEEAKKAVQPGQIGENQPQAYYYLALIQYELGQQVHARQSLDKIIALDKKGDWKTKAVELLNKPK